MSVPVLSQTTRSTAPMASRLAASRTKIPRKAATPDATSTSPARPVRAAAVKERLERHGGARPSSGVGLAEIDWEGRVHADQFSFQRTIGNIRTKPFSEIWSNPEDLYHRQLRDRLVHLKGRCASCRFKTMCGGGLRSRAEAATGDPSAPDPACLQTDEEITAEPVVSGKRGF